MPEPSAAQRETAEKITGPCICHAAYKDRGMSQSDCPRCEYADEIAQALADAVAQERERCATIRSLLTMVAQTRGTWSDDTLLGYYVNKDDMVEIKDALRAGADA